ncbi:hypothetical protein HY478_03990, partial [Candidatus Uhrbacteria bacterium]|nr:hypothetical protein [Candidatus Uhrbacteria bacterium]
DVGEGIFFAGLKHVAIKVIASYTEDQIITSDPSQILAIRKAKQDLANSSQLPGDTPAGIPRPASVSVPGTKESTAIHAAASAAAASMPTDQPQEV